VTDTPPMPTSRAGALQSSIAERDRSIYDQLGYTDTVTVTAVLTRLLFLKIPKSIGELMLSNEIMSHVI